MFFGYWDYGLHDLYMGKEQLKKKNRHYSFTEENG